MTQQLSDTMVEPNLYVLSGQGLDITYSTTSFDGKPRFTYHDTTQLQQFTGDEISATDSPFGTLTVDLGNTTFTLVLPRVNLQGGRGHSICTIGVTTLNRTMLGSIGHAQMTSYHVTTLRGEASQVQF
jgi:hypothetical protein